jgi:hypothetical protein
MSYNLQISGAFSLWDPSGLTVGADALYEFTQGTNAPGRQFSNLMINDKSLPDYMTAGGQKLEFKTNHVYSVNIPGNGNKMKLSYSDSDYGDNSGYLLVRICSGTPLATTAPTATTAQCPNQELESINVAAGNRNNVSSRTVLESGKVYPLRISGTFSLWNSDGIPRGDNSVDALFHYNQDRNQAIEVWSQLWINDKPLSDWLKGSLGRDVTSGDFAQNHVYSINITGSGQVVNFKINDTGAYDDNGGGVTVKICASTGSGPGTVTPTGTGPSTTTPTGTGPGTGTSVGPLEPANVSRMTLQAARRRVLAGSTVTIPVWMINANNVANTNFEMTYNASVARPQSTINPGNLIPDALFRGNAQESGIIRVGFAQTSGASGTGTVAYITFDVVGKAGDRTALTLTVTKINNPSGSDLSIDLIHGEIQIVNPEDLVPGDCDGDTKLTAVDALCALEMSVKLRTERLSFDLDADRQVTSRDSVLILQSTFIR